MVKKPICRRSRENENFRFPMSKSPRAKKYAEMEISLDRARADAYEVELRFTNPLSEAQFNPVKGNMRLDPAALLDLQLSPAAYGKPLASMLFSDERIRSMYGQVVCSID